ncbi:MAG: ubiquitin-like small modifier protein 1 [bacterium]|nr:ubiquitin-like small modifier protein 1 [bacterium]
MKTVRLFATLRDIAGTKEIQIPFRDGQTVRELLSDVTVLHPKLGTAIVHPNGELTGLVHILVHGRNIYWLDGLDTTIREDDQLVFLPPSAGG